jgi:hypothetical protein
MTRRNRIPRTCRFCGSPFETTPSLLARGHGNFCSRPCAYKCQAAEAATAEKLAERFAEHVNLGGPVPTHRPEIGPCHVWTGRTNDAGYGLIGFKGKVERAHRVAFFLTEGRWPDPNALHHCDNPPCVRRAHLFEGTPKQNTADMMAKGRHRHRVFRGDEHWSTRHPERVARGERSGAHTHPERVARGDRAGARRHPESVPRGEAQGSSKLTEAQVRELRAAREQGALLSALAKRFGVTEALVSAIARRKIWRHI